MLSQERRIERYRILYAWKILEGISPNCGLESVISEKRGREIKVPVLKGIGKIHTLREASFQVHGVKLFNSLPKTIMNMRKVPVEEFKSKLDLYLQSIPDEPYLNGYIPTSCDQFSGSPSNSIMDQARSETIRRPG